jgi:hypothetical protein
MSKFSIIDAHGSQQEIEFDVTAYKAAGEKGLSLTQYLNRKFNPSQENGSVLEQCMQQTGLFLKSDRSSGIQPPTMKEVLEGNNIEINTGSIVRNDGAARHGVSGRLLFPEIILQLIESELSTNYGDFLTGYDGMVATTQTVTSPLVDQPVINVTAPQHDDYRSQPIAQLSEPAALVTITVAEKGYRIPTKSIGITISDQALQATTLDLVGIAMTQQANQERVRIVEEAITGMISGDTDAAPDDSALSTFNADTLDSTIAQDGDLTQKAWVHYLRQNYRKMTISHIMCDLDTALAIENRSGRPTMYGVGDGSSLSDDPSSPRIDALFSIENLGLSAPRVLLLDTSVIGANVIAGIDSRYAIRRLVNVSAAYSAIEDYVMRRATSFRVDYGENSHRLMDDAWSVMHLVNS